MHRTAGARMAILQLALIVAGCREDLPGPVKPSWAALIHDNRSLWEAAHIRDYDLVIESGWVMGSTRGARRVEVRGGEVASVVYVETGLQVPDAQRKDMVTRVEELFTVLDDADKNPNARITATFDRELGYPSKLRVNWNTSLIDAVTWITAEVQNARRAT
jgi:Family of unknown function (DUF6174)